MKMMDVERQIEIIKEMFDLYVEPVASGFMFGEVPSSVFAIHCHGTKESDWLAAVRFKNTVTISVFRCEVWLEDIVRLCRRCKIWLITEEVLKIVSAYFMLHPLLQTQNINFTHNTSIGFESMLAGAGDMTYRFLRDHFLFTVKEQRVVLELLNYHNIIYTNLPYGPNKDNIKEAMENEWKIYREIMLEKYPHAYRKSTHYKAAWCRVDEQGFIHFCRNPEARLTHSREETVEEVMKLKGNNRRKGKKEYSITPEWHPVKDDTNTNILSVDNNGFNHISRKSAKNEVTEHGKQEKKSERHVKG